MQQGVSGSNDLIEFCIHFVSFESIQSPIIRNPPKATVICNHVTLNIAATPIPSKVQLGKLLSGRFSSFFFSEYYNRTTPQSLTNQIALKTFEDSRNVWCSRRKCVGKEMATMASEAAAVTGATKGTRNEKREKRDKRGGGSSGSPPSAAFASPSTGGGPNSRLSKPNKEDLEKLSSEIQNQINLLQNESKDIKKQIDQLLGARNGSKVRSPTLHLTPAPSPSLFPSPSLRVS